MSAVSENSVFNNKDRFVQGWYWALRSRELKAGRVKALELLGRKLAVYRGEDGTARTVDAHCPHMGAHLAEGRVDGSSLRCFFHDWKFNETGTCVEAPSLKSAPKACIKTWPTTEKYGMIWVYTGSDANAPVPFVPELESLEVDSSRGNCFIKNCHPNVVMINAIDAHHFNTVHNLPVELLFKTEKINPSAMTFSNTTKLPDKSAFTRFLGRFYAGPLTYKMSYWCGSNGTVTIGPDFLHFHIMFAIRMLENGRAEGQTILITKKRPGVLGWAFNKTLLFLTKIVGNYFAKGDTKIFETIQFDFKTPTKADRAIIDFIQDVETQKALCWETWAPAPIQQESMTALRDNLELDEAEAKLDLSPAPENSPALNAIESH
ncbi:MAG: aromatic ring-hydroxylating dioxygenase subunit alpha [Planctomycetota bacterium]|nr:aromatic ring-hydroxylating dioxygenase subunit alpha [Planctomycetota bacterium]